MKAYKGFKRDMTCQGYQFEEGKSFETETAKLCHSGFHACEDPMDCLRYYPPASSVYHEVELDGVSDERQSDDSKVCAKRISIGERLDIAGVVQAKLIYNKGRASTKKTAGNMGAVNAGYLGEATAGDYGAATAGDRGAATAGDRGAATAGDYGAATAGDRGAATAGDWGTANAGHYGAANAGHCGAATAGHRGAATAGDYGAATAGDRGAATAGDYGAATAGDWGAANAGDGGVALSGYMGASTSGDGGVALSGGKASAGRNGVAVARGVKHDALRVRGGMGALLVIVHEDEDGETVAQCSGLVDGDKIKPDTWYMMKDGAFVEVADD